MGSRDNTVGNALVLHAVKPGQTPDHMWSLELHQEWSLNMKPGVNSGLTIAGYECSKTNTYTTIIMMASLM